MPKPTGETWNRVMQAIAIHGPMNYLELELLMSRGGLIKVLSKMKQNGCLVPLPKVRLELKRYGLSEQAKSKIGIIMDHRESLLHQTGVMDRPTWTPPSHDHHRAGSRDALLLPSLIQGQQVAPRCPA